MRSKISLRRWLTAMSVPPGDVTVGGAAAMLDDERGAVRVDGGEPFELRDGASSRDGCEESDAADAWRASDDVDGRDGSGAPPAAWLTSRCR